ncbi:hypothetical protein BT63DRAFT_177326 [Microthyrium microscopicum]|uniref:Uncharacterized protein n=1 Tax=Microthyrium microscopicum TaxID=703497 RepID=A0A6A6UHE1_9PEZI|nr:hypothetical protein BT63DRAFT_177326 [Microthyrium microscopicum]
MRKLRYCMSEFDLPPFVLQTPSLASTYTFTAKIQKMPVIAIVQYLPEHIHCPSSWHILEKGHLAILKVAFSVYCAMILTLYCPMIANWHRWHASNSKKKAKLYRFINDNG